jgi:hypothetical protein
LFVSSPPTAADSIALGERWEAELVAPVRFPLCCACGSRARIDIRRIKAPALAAAVSLPWIEIVELVELEEIVAFARYKAELGGGAGFLAWAYQEGLLP